MSEPYTSEQSLRQLSSELSYCLEPVPAPEALWGRVQTALETRSSFPSRSACWLAACLLLAMAAATVWYARLHQGGPPSFEAAALAAHRELSRHPQRLDLRTASATELRSWIAAKSGLTANLALERPQPDPDALEILGARLISFLGESAAAILYRIGPNPATLLIARASSANPAPKRIRSRSVRKDGLELFTWQAGSQIYALVSSVPASSERACFVCHVEPQRRRMILLMKLAG